MVSLGASSASLGPNVISVPFDIEHQDVHLELFFDQQLVCGNTSLMVRPLTSQLSEIRLNLKSASIHSVCINGIKSKDFIYKDPLSHNLNQITGKYNGPSTSHINTQLSSERRRTQSINSLDNFNNSAQFGVKLNIPSAHPSEFSSSPSAYPQSATSSTGKQSVHVDPSISLSRNYDAKYFQHFRSAYSKSIQQADDGELIIPISPKFVKHSQSSTISLLSHGLSTAKSNSSLNKISDENMNTDQNADKSDIKPISFTGPKVSYSFEAIKVDIVYAIKNPKSGCQFILPNSIEREHLYPQFYTNNQLGFARNWIPCIDIPYRKSTWNINLTFPSTLGRAYPSAFGLVKKGDCSVLNEALELVNESKASVPKLNLSDTYVDDGFNEITSSTSPLPPTKLLLRKPSVSNISNLGQSPLENSAGNFNNNEIKKPSLKISLGKSKLALSRKNSHVKLESPSPSVLPPVLDLETSTDTKIDEDSTKRAAPSENAPQEPLTDTVPKKRKITLSLSKLKKSKSSSSISSQKSDATDESKSEAINSTIDKPASHVEKVKEEIINIEDVELDIMDAANKTDTVNNNISKLPSMAINTIPEQPLETKYDEKTEVAQKGTLKDVTSAVSSPSVNISPSVSSLKIETVVEKIEEVTFKCLFSTNMSSMTQDDLENIKTEELVFEDGVLDKLDQGSLDSLRKEIRRPLMAISNGFITKSYTDKRFQRTTTCFKLEEPTSAQNISVVVGPFEKVPIRSWSIHAQAIIKFGENCAKQQSDSSNVENQEDDNNDNDDTLNEQSKNKTIMREHKITNAGGAFAYCLPGKMHMLEYTIGTVSQALGFIEQYLDFEYPHSTFKLIFVDDSYNLISTTSSLILASSHLLVDPKIIDQTPETLRVLVKSIAEQWFGGYLPVKSSADNWLIIGLVNFITSLFSRKYLGKNEYKWRLSRDMKRVCTLDVNQSPLYPLNPNNPDTVADSTLAMINGVPVANKKEPHATVNILNPGSAGISPNSVKAEIDNSQSAGIVLPKVVFSAPKPKQVSLSSVIVDNEMYPTPQMLQHFYPDDDEYSLTAELFSLKSPIVIYMLNRHLGKGLLQKLLNQILASYKNGSLVYGLSTRNFLRLSRYISGNQQQILDFADQWIYGSGCPKINVTYHFNRKRMTIEFKFSQENTNSANNANMKFTGPFTIRIHEPGGMYDTEVHIDSSQAQFDVPYHTKKKVTKKNITSAVANMNWGEDDTERSAFDWIRIDPDFHWLCEKNFEQADFMWALQLEQDRDVFAQCESINALKSLASENTCAVLRTCMMDSTLFYGVRMDAAISLAHCITEMKQSLATKFLLQPFEEKYCLPSETVFSTITTRYILPEGVTIFDKESTGAVKKIINTEDEHIKIVFSKKDKRLINSSETVEIPIESAIEEIFTTLKIKKNATTHKSISNPSDITYIRKLVNHKYFYVKPNDFTNLQDYYVRRAFTRAISIVREGSLQKQRPCIELLLRLLRFNDNSDNFYSDNYYIAGLILYLGDCFVRRLSSKCLDSNDILPREPLEVNCLEDIVLSQTIKLKSQIQDEQANIAKSIKHAETIEEDAVNSEIEDFGFDSDNNEKQNKNEEDEYISETEKEEETMEFTKKEYNKSNKFDPEIELKSIPTSDLIKESYAEISRYLSLDEIIPNYHNTVTISCLRVYLKWMITGLIPVNVSIFLRYSQPGNFFKVREIAVLGLLCLGLTDFEIAEYVLFIIEEDESVRFRYFVASLLHKYVKLLFTQHLNLLQTEKITRSKHKLPRSAGRPVSLIFGTPFEQLITSTFGTNNRFRYTLKIVEDERIRLELFYAFQLLSYQVNK